MRTLLRCLVVGGCSVLSMGDSLAWSQQPAASAPNSAQYAPPAWAAQAALTWYDNLDAALKAAPTQRKFILVHFWNDNCPPCVGVERNVFSRPEVQQAIGANFIPVKIKVDDQPEVARKYRVDRWPTDVVLSADGQELFRTVSSQNPSQYIAILGRVAATARGATSAVQDATRSANSWADRMAASIPSFGEPNAPPPTPPPSATGASAAANFQATSGPQAPDTSARSSFQPPAGDRFTPPAPSSPQVDTGTTVGPGLVNERGYGTSPAAATSPADTSRFQPAASQTAANAFVPPSPSANAFASSPPAASPSPPSNDRFALPPSPAPAASGAPPIGLEGFCPVTLFDTRKWRRADARWGVIHRDRTYLFAGADEQRRFLENPDRYAPMLSGYDPVRYVEQGQLVEGRRQHGVWFRNQMFLFADEGSLERFWKDPDVVVPRVEQAMRATAGDGMFRR